MTLHEVPHDCLGAEELLSHADARFFGFSIQRNAAMGIEEWNDLVQNVEELEEFFVDHSCITVGDSRFMEVAKESPIAKDLSDLREPAKLGPVHLMLNPNLTQEIIALRRNYGESAKEYLRRRTDELLAVGILERGATSYS